MAKRDVFSGTTALITGASSGIGEEFARELARRHCNLVLTARSRDKLERLAEDLARVNGVSVQVIVQDLSEPDGALSLARELRERGLEIDHLINNAGFGVAGRFETTDVERQLRMLRVNTESVLVLTRSLLRGMLEPAFPHVRGRQPEYRDFRAGDMRHSLADIEKAKTLLGYEPGWHVRQGLAEAIEWYVGDETARRPAGTRRVDAREHIAAELQ